MTNFRTLLSQKTAIKSNDQLKYHTTRSPAVTEIADRTA